MDIFSFADILLPREELMEKWAVIACDQFSSQPEYWRKAAEIAGDAPSALRLILPEAELGPDPSAQIRRIDASSVLAWRIPGTEEPSGLPSMGSQRVRHD